MYTVIEDLKEHGTVRLALAGMSRVCRTAPRGTVTHVMLRYTVTQGCYLRFKTHQSTNFYSYEINSYVHHN